MRTEDNKLYLCDEGKIFIRKSDGDIMGDGMDLGINDSIDNYEEIDDPSADSDSDSEIEE